MTEPKVHNYAFRKTLGYVRNKKGKLEYENVKITFENATSKRISTLAPYMPSYLSLKSFVILLQIIKERLGDENITTGGVASNRCYDVGFYLYMGSEEVDSPYNYLDPHKQLPNVMGDFYHNLETPSGIFKYCGTMLTHKGSRIKATWLDLEEYSDFIDYLKGMHAGMIRASASRGVLSTKKKDDAIMFEIKLLR